MGAAEIASEVGVLAPGDLGPVRRQLELAPGIVAVLKAVLAEVVADATDAAAAIAARTIVAAKLPVLGLLSTLVAAVNPGSWRSYGPMNRLGVTSAHTRGASSHVAPLPRDIDLADDHAEGAQVRLDELTKAKANADDQAPAGSDRAIRTVEER